MLFRFVAISVSLTRKASHSWYRVGLLQTDGQTSFGFIEGTLPGDLSVELSAGLGAGEPEDRGDDDALGETNSLNQSSPWACRSAY